MLHVLSDIISSRMYNWPCDTQGLKNNFSPRVSEIEGFGFLFQVFRVIHIGSSFLRHLICR